MFEQELSQLEKQHLLRRFMVVEYYDGPRITVNGRSLLLMCSNDYLGLSGHPSLMEAAAKAVPLHDHPPALLACHAPELLVFGGSALVAEWGEHPVERLQM